jgi:hypothetical protein
LCLSIVRLVRHWRTKVVKAGDGEGS